VNASEAEKTSDKFNTRVVTFDVVPVQKYGQAVEEALQFEILILERDARQGFITRDEEKSRINELKKCLKEVVLKGLFLSLFIPLIPSLLSRRI
jgi:hypothetical protein